MDGRPDYRPSLSRSDIQKTISAGRQDRGPVRDTMLAHAKRWRLPAAAWNQTSHVLSPSKGRKRSRFLIRHEWRPLICWWSTPEPTVGTQRRRQDHLPPRGSHFTTRPSVVARKSAVANGQGPKVVNPATAAAECSRARGWRGTRLLVAGLKSSARRIRFLVGLAPKCWVSWIASRPAPACND